MVLSLVFCIFMHSLLMVHASESQESEGIGEVLFHMLSEPRTFLIPVKGKS